MENKGILAALLLCTLATRYGVQSQDCYLEQTMEPYKTYYIYNREYPNYYRGSGCRWVANTPVVAQIELACSVVNIPGTPGYCTNDKLSIFEYRAPNYLNSDNFCGRSPIHKVYNTNQLIIDLVVSPAGVGLFNCTLVAMYFGGGTPPTARPTNPPPCDCGWMQNRRIVGGTETQVNQYPFMAAFVKTYPNTSPDDKVWCGSTIISDRYAVSAAHCMPDVNQLRYYGLLVGEHRLSTAAESGATVIYAIQYYTKHENYIAATWQNDIAIIKTQRVIQFSLSVGPACLPYSYRGFMTFAEKQAKIMGWGTDSFTGRKSDVLEEADVTVVTNDVCAANLIGNTITKDMICAYGYRKDACQYDSGGPLLWYNQNIGRYILIGIVIFGDGCGSNKPGVYTRVTSYVDWIQSKIQDSNYCTKN